MCFVQLFSVAIRKSNRLPPNPTAVWPIFVSIARELSSIGDPPLSSHCIGGGDWCDPCERFPITNPVRLPRRSSFAKPPRSGPILHHTQHQIEHRHHRAPHTHPPQISIELFELRKANNNHGGSGAKESFLSTATRRNNKQVPSQDKINQLFTGSKFGKRCFDCFATGWLAGWWRFAIIRQRLTITSIKCLNALIIQIAFSNTAHATPLTVL